MLSQTIGFIGAGQMAQALARGFVAAGLVEAKQFVAADPAPAALEAFCRFLPGARPVADNRAVIGGRRRRIPGREAAERRAGR